MECAVQCLYRVFWYEVKLQQNKVQTELHISTLEANTSYPNLIQNIDLN